MTVDRVKEYATSLGLDPDNFIEGGQLVFSEDDRFAMMSMLNEDLYRGPLSEGTFEAQRKARR